MRVTEIGEIVADGELFMLDANGNATPLARKGYKHF
jgi:thiamine monophosphate kinase